MPYDRSALERMRDDLLRRARSERVEQGGDVEQAMPETWGTQRQPEVQMGGQEQPREAARPFSVRLSRLGQLFGGRDRQPAASHDEASGQAYVESPRPADFSFPPAQHEGPDQAYAWTDRSAEPPMQPNTYMPGFSNPPWLPQDMPLPPEPAAARMEETDEDLPFETSAFDAVGPEDVHLARLADDSRRRRRRQQHWAKTRRHQQARRTRKKPPRRFLFCFPWVRSRRMRSLFSQCFVSGLFLCCMLAIYLGLTVSKALNKTNSQSTIIFLLIILSAALFFCYSIIRLCLLSRKGRRVQASRRARMPQKLAPGGYAVPDELIHVVMAQDVEAAGAESVTSNVTPPPYGRWRDSVRVDPDRIFWQRNHDSAAAADHEDDTQRWPGRRSPPRPPSYASDDGVSYVVDAVPRSTAPTDDLALPLPVHPSNAGRGASTQASSVYSVFYV